VNKPLYLVHLPSRACRLPAQFLSKRLDINIERVDGWRAASGALLLPCPGHKVYETHTLVLSAENVSARTRERLTGNQ
jgi:hypothetical protein